jgi:hypothetical protein
MFPKEGPGCLFQFRGDRCLQWQDLYFNLAICRSTRDDCGLSSVDSLRVTSARKIVLVGLHRV